MEHDTIAALSTPPGHGGIAVIRISGENSLAVLRKITKKSVKNIVFKKVMHRAVHASHQVIEHCLAVAFQAPHSYTGEDVVELSLHSNPFLIEEVLNLIFQCGARPALPGEFTFRAFKNKKLDLIQAEAVNELIMAGSRYSAHITCNNLEGKFSHLIEQLKENLTGLAVALETIIEFAEDQFMENTDLLSGLTQSQKEISQILANARFHDVFSQGMKVVIAGTANVGKSSLFNHLLQQDRSITSEIPGTTRDFIKEKIYISGMPLEIIDIAGIREQQSNKIESEGMRRSIELIKQADAVIFMLDGTRFLQDADRDIYRLLPDKPRLVVINKADAADKTAVKHMKEWLKSETVIEISVKQDQYIDLVRNFLKEIISAANAHETAIPVNQRQKAKLEEIASILEKIRGFLDSEFSHTELIAEEIRQALRVIGELTGEITSDEVINRIFSQFCVGK